MRTRLPVPGMLLLLWLISTSIPAFPQAKNEGKRKIPDAALEHIKKNKNKFSLSDEDIDDLVVSNEYITKHNGVKHVYLIQRYKGIEIHGAVTNLNLSKEGKVLSMGNRFQKGIGKKAKPSKSVISASEAVQAAARHLNTSLTESLTVIEPEQGENKSTVFSKGGISLEPIPAKLVYQPMQDGSLQLAWEVTIYEVTGENWWMIRLDAASGEVLEKDNLVVHCEFENEKHTDHSNHQHKIFVAEKTGAAIPYAPVASGTYNVYPWPVESPNHGSRAIISESTADETASPLGWHDTGSILYTITRGNNVYAYEDPNNTGYAQGDIYGFSPDGGPSRTFDYPIDFSQEPVHYNEAAITNLFYWNNIVHDMWYQYGFDEVSGNFQTNNFGRGGVAGDHVMAEAQDSRNILTTRNNANFATGVDGVRPRMQMYLWSGLPDQDLFRVTSPAAIAGSYPAIQAVFSAPLTPVPVTGKLVMMDDGLEIPQGCDIPANALELAGNIAVVYRGTCAFTIKVENAQLAGAIAVIVINNAPGNPIPMGGVPTIPVTIPAVMVSDVTGALMRDQMDSGTDVIVALKDDGSGPEVDGDFDNVIIAHEYGHGISNRLTGGPAVVNCLNNAEQAGEGWSDWFGLMMTMKEGDEGPTGRGVGTFAQNEPVSGLGIRPARYSTSFAVNPATYGLTNNPGISQPHGVGFVFATMLWDMTWALVDEYGFDADLSYGNGGNNMAMQLVIDGLKLQPCRPGFVDARDAILLADRINYGGANQELLWNVFARRGLGYSADQGLNTSRFDQVESFDLPPSYLCEEPLSITAIPGNNVYTGGVPTNLYLGYGPQNVTLQASGDPSNSYTWSPAAGLNNPNIANPVFTPTAAGVYTFTATAVNDDYCTRQVSITITVIDVLCGKKNEKISMCSNGTTECVSKNAVQGKLAEGGSLGSCNSLPVMEATPQAITRISNYPNPFQSSTTVTFSVENTGFISLKVYDLVGGREVATLFEGDAESGVEYATEFVRPYKGPGMYVYKLVTNEGLKTGTMIVNDQY